MIKPLANNSYFVFVFANTHRAIEAQKYLKGQDILILPTPSIIHRSCGIAILCKTNNYLLIQSILAEHMTENIDFTAHHLQFLGQGRWQNIIN